MCARDKIRGHFYSDAWLLTNPLRAPETTSIESTSLPARYLLLSERVNAVILRRRDDVPMSARFTEYYFCISRTPLNFRTLYYQAQELWTPHACWCAMGYRSSIEALFVSCSSALLSQQSALNDYETMGSIQRRDLSKLACRLHCVWRPGSTIPNGGRGVAYP